MKKKMKAFTGVLLSLMLVISLLPALSLAEETPDFTVDLTSGQAVMDQADAEAILKVLDEAASQNRINREFKSSSNIRYDLNRDGTKDLGYMVETVTIGKSKITAYKFTSMTSTVPGEFILEVPKSETQEKDMEILFKFPLNRIEQVEVTNVNTTLKPGERPAFTATLTADSASKAEVKSEHWIDSNANTIIESDVINDRVIIAGHTYEYGIELTAKPGYYFDETTKLIYRGKTYSLAEVGHTVKVEGSGLALWDFQDDVDVIVDCLDELTMDLRTGKATLPEQRAKALGASMNAARESGQINMTTDIWEADLDKDGTPDVRIAYSESLKQGTVTVLTDTLSLEKDTELTLSADTLKYLTDNGISPYIKKIIFKMEPAASTYDLDVSEGKVTVKGEDLDKLIDSLLADGDGGLIDYSQNNTVYEFDLDKSGTKDLKLELNLAGTEGEFSQLETSSIREKVVLKTPLGQIIAMAGGSTPVPFFTQVSIRMKPAEPAKDLGSCTVDVSAGTATKTTAEWEAIRASLAGLNFTRKIRTKTEGERVWVDLDMDSVYDVCAEIKSDGSAIISFDEENSKMKKNASFTLGDPEITVAGSYGRKAYYKDLTFKVPGQPLPFVDVTKGEYFYEAVEWAVEEAVTTGTDDTHFSPGVTCTRAQVVTFLWRSAGSPEPTSSTNPFTDVKAEDYFYKAVLWAVEKNITKGMSDTEFGPESPCTRGQVVTFLHRYENTPAPGSITNPFTDVSASDYFYTAVLWAVEKEITKGMTETTFEPGGPCTRGQVVTFLYRSK